MRPDILGYEKGDTGIVHLRIRGLARATPSSCTFQWKRDSSQKKPQKNKPQNPKQTKCQNKQTKTPKQSTSQKRKREKVSFQKANGLRPDEINSTRLI